VPKLFQQTLMTGEFSMVRKTFKISALVLIAGSLSACETVGEAASSTSQAVSSWYQSAKGTITDSDQSEAAEQGYFAREFNGNLATADAQAIDREGAMALDQGVAGTAVEWRNPETGVEAVFIPGDPVFEKRKITTSLKKGVTQPVDLEIIGSTYQSRHSANLRSAPGIENSVVGRLNAGELFTAVGRSGSQAWILVAKEGRMVGYVYEPLVAPASAGAPPPELREVNTLQPNGENPQATRDKPVLNTILAATPCRNLAYDVVTGDGQRTRAELRACKAGDGAWEIN
jgi:surface antigen